MKCLSDYYTSVSEVESLEMRSRLTSATDICGNLSGIFSGLLAYGFDTVSGAGGLSGWQWYEAFTKA